MSETLSGDDLRTVDEARAKYAAVLGELDGLVRTAPLIGTGFSVCNDHICSVGEAEFAAIVEAQDDDDQEVRDLARWLHDRILNGRGGEVLAARRGFDWIARTFRGTPTMGGTGAQVSRVLASLGVQSVLALTDRTAVQLETMDDGLRVVGDDGDLHSPREITPSTERTERPDLRLPVHAGRAAARSHRRCRRRGDDAPLDPHHPACPGTHPRSGRCLRRIRRGTGG